MSGTVPLDRGVGLYADRGVVHGFTGRGGAPGGLTLAASPTLPADRLVDHWTRALRAVAPALSTDRLALMDQVHGAEVVRVSAPTGPLATVGAADAVWTTEPGLALAVRVADCVPILLAAPGGVAAVHAGWRGVALGITPSAVCALAAGVGVSPADVHAVIGPHIGVDAYEVGPEVVDGVAASGVPVATFARRGRGDRWQVDLGAAVAAQLAAAGVTTVAHTGGCTTGPGYFSWRGDGPTTGRQAGIVAWCP